MCPESTSWNAPGSIRSSTDGKWQSRMRKPAERSTGSCPAAHAGGPERVGVDARRARPTGPATRALGTGQHLEPCRRAARSSRRRTDRWRRRDRGCRGRRRLPMRAVRRAPLRRAAVADAALAGDEVSRERDQVGAQLLAPRDGALEASRAPDRGRHARRRVQDRDTVECGRQAARGGLDDPLAQTARLDRAPGDASLRTASAKRALGPSTPPLSPGTVRPASRKAGRRRASRMRSRRSVQERLARGTGAEAPASARRDAAAPTRRARAAAHALASDDPRAVSCAAPYPEAYLAGPGRGYRRSAQGGRVLGRRPRARRLARRAVRSSASEAAPPDRRSGVIVSARA